MKHFKFKVTAQCAEDSEKARVLQSLMNHPWAKVPDALMDQAKLEVMLHGRVLPETEKEIIAAARESGECL